MIRSLALALTLAAGTACSSAATAGPDAAAEAQAVVGSPAPDFHLTDLEGRSVSLSEFRGKTVVLEWFNPGCPFVKYGHGEGGPLRGLERRVRTPNTAWLAINSGAEGKQGHDPAMNVQARQDWEIDYPVLRDPNGLVGRLYGAKTTPQMYVINAEGTLVYAGALDNNPMGRQNPRAPVNYVTAALDDLANDRPVAVSETQPYGCSVKY